MPTSHLRIAYRPIRVGFLVRARSTNDIREAIRITSLLWGGFANPLLAVGGDEQLDRQIASFRVDALHGIAPSDDVAPVIERHDHVRWPRIGEGGIITSDGRPYLRAFDLASALQSFEQRFRESRVDRPAVWPSWEDDDPYAAVYALTFGDYTRGEELLQEDVAQQFSAITGAVAAHADSGPFHGRWLPDAAAMVNIERPRVSRDTDLELFLGNPRSPRDLLHYWNLRSGGRGILFWDRTGSGQPFRRTVERELEIVNELRSMGTFRPGADDQRLSVACYCAAADDDVWDTLTAELPQLLDDEVFLLQHPIDDAFASVRVASLRELPSALSSNVMVNVENQETRSTLAVQLPRPPVRERTSLQSCAIEVDATIGRSYRGTLQFPYLPDLNRWIGWEVTTTDSVRVGYESFGVIHDLPTTTLTLRTVPDEMLLARLFERAGITTTRSLPGEVARHLLIQLGGLARCRVLRIPGVRKLLSATQARTGIRGGQAIQMIRDKGSFEGAEKLYSMGTRLDPTGVFKLLLHRRMFLPGFELECPACRHGSFYAPRDLDDEVRCPRCTELFALGPALQSHSARFRISGLLEERSERLSTTTIEPQPSAIPVLLTLLFLSEWEMGIEGSLFEVSHELQGTEIDDCETDIAVVSYGTRPRLHTDILIGECKGQGQIDAGDLSKLTLVASRLEASGVECTLLFSTTRPAFSDAELALFREHVETQGGDGIGLVLLTGAELQEHLFRVTNQAVGDYSMRGLRGLVDYTRDRYFTESDLAAGA